MNTVQTEAFIQDAKAHSLFKKLYGNDDSIVKKQTERYIALVRAFKTRFGDADLRLFSSPGRSEIGGNHTDHNLGKVLAASIQLDSIAAVTQTDDGSISIFDLTYNEDFTVKVSDSGRVSGEKGSIALIRGIIQGFKDAGFAVGGFKGAFTSDVIAAAGVSSSASFEMLICLILNNLYNNGSIPVHRFAAIGQFAENRYWDKGSGLLDQMACAVGGLISIDFKDPTAPIVEKVPFDFAKENYSLMIVNTGKGHADLSAEYSSIPNEMKAVAKQLGQSTLRGLTYQDIIGKLPQLRAACGDRAIMRALHFIEENCRVDAEVKALKENNFQKFLTLITDSGNSSWKWLQNVYVNDSPEEQSISVCLALTERFIREKGAGACRIHGGGFAGVILAFIPNNLRDEYTAYMNKALDYDSSKADAGRSPVYAMSIRPLGSIEITS